MPAYKDGSVLAFFNYGSGTCLDLTESNPKDATPVIGYHWHGGKNQQWKLVKIPYSKVTIFPVYLLVNQATGTTLDLKAGGKDNGTQIQCWTNQPDTPKNPNQLWRITTADNNSDVVAIQNIGTGTFVDLYLGGEEDRTKITGWAGNPFVEENTHQLWKIQVIS